MAGKINKQKAIELICEELDKGSTYSECMQVIASKCKVHETTFVRYWKEANARHLERQQAIQAEVNEQRVELEKERVKTAIKTKNERVGILQFQIENLIKELEEGMCMDVDSKNRPFSRHLLPAEKTNMRKAIKDLQSEISKIEGDYAAIKNEHDINGSISPENWLMLQGKK